MAREEFSSLAPYIIQEALLMYCSFVSLCFGMVFWFFFLASCENSSVVADVGGTNTEG